jgi:hypothetical protein
MCETKAFVTSAASAAQLATAKGAGVAKDNSPAGTGLPK